MTKTLNEIITEEFELYEAGRVAGRLTVCDTEVKVIVGMWTMAINRDRCYICDPQPADLFEAEVVEQYGLGCEDSNHHVYSAGFTAGAMETMVEAAGHFRLWQKDAA